MQTDFESVKKVDNSEVNFINTWLKARYGTGAHDRQLFRVVWSNDLLEKRFSTFEDWYGHIFIRRETGVRQTKKYSYIKDRWILERLAYQPVKEIIGSELGHYEPLYVFQNKKGDYLPPLKAVVEFILNGMFNGRAMTASEWKDLNEREQKRILELTEDYLAEDMQYIPSALRAGEAIIVPSSYKKD